VKHRLQNEFYRDRFLRSVAGCSPISKNSNGDAERELHTFNLNGIIIDCKKIRD
jgi:hypothetical protein